MVQHVRMFVVRLGEVRSISESGWMNVVQCVCVRERLCACTVCICKSGRMSVVQCVCVCVCTHVRLCVCARAVLVRVGE